MNISIYDTHVKLEGEHSDAEYFKGLDEIVDIMGPELFESFSQIRTFADFIQLKLEVERELSKLTLRLTQVDEEFLTAIASLSWLRFHSTSSTLDSFSIKMDKVETEYGKIVPGSRFNVYNFTSSPLYYLAKWYHSVFFFDGSGVFTSRSKFYISCMIELYKGNKDLFIQIMDRTTLLTATDESSASESAFLRSALELVDISNPLETTMFFREQVKDAIERYYQKTSKEIEKNYQFLNWEELSKKSISYIVREVASRSADRSFEFYKKILFFNKRFSKGTNNLELEAVAPIFNSIGEIGKRISKGEIVFNSVSLEDFKSSDSLTQEIISLSYMTYNYEDSWEARNEFSLSSFRESLHEATEKHFKALAEQLSQASTEDLIKAL